MGDVPHYMTPQGQGEAAYMMRQQREAAERAAERKRLLREQKWRELCLLESLPASPERDRLIAQKKYEIYGSPPSQEKTSRHRAPAKTSAVIAWYVVIVVCLVLAMELMTS